MTIHIDHTTDRLDTTSEVLDIDDTGAIRIPRGTTAQRPATPADGMLRLELGSGLLEYWWNGAWRSVASSVGLDETRIHDVDDSTWVDTDESVETVTFGTNGAERMRLTSTGRLGIGTTTPSAGLEVLYSGAASMRIEQAGAPDVAVFRASSASSSRVWLADDSSTNEAQVAIGSSGDALQFVAGGAVRAELGPGITFVIGGTGGSVGLEVRTTDGMVIPVGTTAQRPPGSNGMIRYNSDNDVIEAFIAGTWTELASKSYVDSVAQGLTWKEPVRVKDTASTDTAGYTYNPGVDGGPNALVWTGVTTAPTWDGVTIADGDRILITEASDKRGNGIFVYDATAQGFRRAPDADNSPGAELAGGTALFVLEGTTYADSGWVLSDPQGTVNLGTDQIYFIQFTAAAALTASNGIIRIGNDFQLTGQASALHNFTGIGYLVRTGPAAFVSRSFQGTANQIQILNADGTAGNTVISISNDPELPGTARVRVPTGTTADRPTTPVAGDVRFNTDNSQLEFYDGTGWFRLGNNGDFVLRSGDVMLGPLGFVPGSAAAPGLYVSGDVDTGVFQTSADTLSLGAGGFGFLFYDRTANLFRVDVAGFADRISIDGSTGYIGLGQSPNYDVDMGSLTGALAMPKGGTAQRPATPTAGLIRFNTDTGKAEIHDGANWVDLVTSSSSTPRYVQTFNSTTDWSGPVGGLYSLTVTSTTHGRGTDPVVQVFEGSGPYTVAMPHTVEVAVNGDVTLYVSEVPDGRFGGKVVIV